MSDAERLAELRELFLVAPESGAARLLALVLSFGLVCIVLWLVRRRTLRAEYTPIWKRGLTASIRCRRRRQRSRQRAI